MVGKNHSACKKTAVRESSNKVYQPRLQRGWRARETCHVHVHEKGPPPDPLRLPSADGFVCAMDHEKLDVYRVSLDLVTRIGPILRSKDIDRSLREQVVRSSTSILLNIAEGPGKRPPAAPQIL